MLDVTASSQSPLLTCSGTDPAVAAQVAASDALSQGLLMAFAWTSAMAYNQGEPFVLHI